MTTTAPRTMTLAEANARIDAYLASRDRAELVRELGNAKSERARSLAQGTQPSDDVERLRAAIDAGISEIERGCIVQGFIKPQHAANPCLPPMIAAAVTITETVENFGPCCTELQEQGPDGPCLRITWNDSAVSAGSLASALTRRYGAGVIVTHRAGATTAAWPLRRS